MRSTLARRIFATTLAVVIVGPLTSGFTINRTDLPHRIVADQNSQESVQLQVKEISRRPNDINDGNNGITTKATPFRTILWNVTGNLEKESDVPKVDVEYQLEGITRRPKNINDGKNEIATKATSFRTISWNETGHLEKESDVPKVGVQLEVEDISRRPNNSNDGINIITTKATPVTTISWTETGHPGKESVPKVGVHLQDEDISRRPNENNEGKNDVTFKAASVSAISRNETGHPEKESDIFKVTVTDLILQPNIRKITTKNVNNNETTPPKLNTSQDTEENTTVTTSALISQITQPVTNPSLKEDGSNMPKTTTEKGTILNIDQMTTYSETNADLSYRKDSTSSESKTDMTTYKSEIIKDDVVGETTPELTTTEEIVFRNSKTPEMVVTKEVFRIEDTSTADTISTNDNNEKPSVTTVPSWKKYVTIDRKRTSSEEITTEIVDRDQKPSEISQTIEEVPLELSVWLPNNDNKPSTDTNLQLTTIENKSVEKEKIVTVSEVDDIRLKNNDSTPSTDTNLQLTTIENKSMDKDGIVTTSKVDEIRLKNNDSTRSTNTNSQLTTIENKSTEKEGIVSTSEVADIRMKNNNSISSTDTYLQLTTIENKSMEKDETVTTSDVDHIRLKNNNTIPSKDTYLQLTTIENKSMEKEGMMSTSEVDDIRLKNNKSIPSTDTYLQLTTIKNQNTEKEGIMTTSDTDDIRLKNNNSIPSTDTYLQLTTIENQNMEKERIVSTSEVDDIILKNNKSIPSTDTYLQVTTIENKNTEKEGIATTSDADDIRLKNNNSIPSFDTYLQLTTIENKSMEKEGIVSSSDANDISLKNISTVDTKRGGFLNLSKTSSSEPSLTTDKNTKMFEKQVFISQTIPTKKASVAESQSQLTDDAIKEELLKEEMIINHEENIIRHQKVQQVDDENQIMEVAPVVKGFQHSEQEDNLSVQPISQDRRTTLYTVSPNYKPMKKIDVQPPKPFVRDPDDNSWRNESISSLGIVFKPKNSTKSFKQVLKNKTETEFSNIPENKDSKNELPHLRSRLEKIAEVRKSKKKKTNKSGEEISTDYEENSSEEASTSTTTLRIDNMVFDLFNTKSTILKTTTPIPFTKLETTTEKLSDDLFKKVDVDTMTTDKPNKYFNVAEYYDTTDEYDADYVTLPKIDLKKFTRPYITTITPLTQTVTSRYTTKSMSRSQSPERKGTVQYFPPRTVEKVNIDHYDDEFQKKVNYYTPKDNVHSEEFFSFTNLKDPIATEQPTTTPSSEFENISRPPVMTTTTQSRLSSPHGFILNDENFNRGSYVIKHYKDFLNEAAKTSEYDKFSDFVYPDHPEKVNGLTTSPLLDTRNFPPKKTENNYYYESEFRKDVLNRFVENFNQNSERFKIDFPILYNNSIVHQKSDEDGRVASSSANLKRQYENEVVTKPSLFSNTRKSCDPNCDMMVELSPAYELHYFVPDQEEKEPPPVESPPPSSSFNL